MCQHAKYIRTETIKGTLYCFCISSMFCLFTLNIMMTCLLPHFTSCNEPLPSLFPDPQLFFGSCSNPLTRYWTKAAFSYQILLCVILHFFYRSFMLMNYTLGVVRFKAVILISRKFQDYSSSMYPSSPSAHMMLSHRRHSIIVY